MVKFIPIGMQCSNASCLNEIKLRTEAYPFDWILSTPNSIYQILKLLMETDDINDLVRNHFIKCEKRAKITSVENYVTDEDGSALYNESYHLVFPHDAYNEETIEKYIKRFHRLKELILNQNETIYFLYTSQSSLEKGNYTINNEQVIENVYQNCNDIYDLISKYRKNFGLIILDAIFNEDISILKQEIMIFKLKSCDIWCDIVPQMKIVMSKLIRVLL
jgi:hypothetical protein